MRPLRYISLGSVAMAAAALTGCLSGSGGESSGGSGAQSADGQAGGYGYGGPGRENSAEESTAKVSLATAKSDLGTIVVDGAKMTVYMFDNDTRGAKKSSCKGECIKNWPAVHGDDTASVDGVTGKVGSITSTDGKAQLTLNGWPLYYFAGDESAGDVKGQGLMKVWWVLKPDGTPVGK